MSTLRSSSRWAGQCAARFSDDTTPPNSVVLNIATILTRHWSLPHTMDVPATLRFAKATFNNVLNDALQSRFTAARKSSPHCHSPVVHLHTDEYRTCKLKHNHQNSSDPDSLHRPQCCRSPSCTQRCLSNLGIIETRAERNTLAVTAPPSGEQIRAQRRSRSLVAFGGGMARSPAGKPSITPGSTQM